VHLHFSLFCFIANFFVVVKYTAMTNIIFSSFKEDELESFIENSVYKAFKNLNSNNIEKKDAEQFMSVREAAELLCLRVPTLYSLVSKSQIPYHKRAKRLYFSKQELINWIKTGRKKTISEIEAEAATQLITKNKMR
jgi:excisionase family DNA binding protein